MTRHEFAYWWSLVFGPLTLGIGIGWLRQRHPWYALMAFALAVVHAYLVVQHRRGRTVLP